MNIYFPSLNKASLSSRPSLHSWPTVNQEAASFRLQQLDLVGRFLLLCCSKKKNRDREVRPEELLIP